MNNRYIKKTYSITLIIREMQIKATIRYLPNLLKQLSPRRQETANIGKNVEKREPWYKVSGNENWHSHCGKQYRVSPEKQ